MKKILSFSLLLLFVTEGYSQNSHFDFKGWNTPVVKKERLKSVNFLHELIPQLFTKLGIPERDRDEIKRLRERDFTQSFRIYPIEYDYSRIIDYVSMEVERDYNGKSIFFKSNGDELTFTQKELFANASLGESLNIRILFKYKNNGKEDLNSGREVEAVMKVTVVPEVEASFIGGAHGLEDYINEKMFSGFPDAICAKITRAEVQFTIAPSGKAIDAKILVSSKDPIVDNLIIQTILEMPSWIPGKDSRGEAVSQRFAIPFWGGC